MTQTRPDALDLAKEAAHLCDDGKARDIVILDVAELIVITDYFVICTGTNTRQTKAIGKAIEKEFKDRYGLLAKSHEGYSDPTWVLIDYGSVVVHIFLEETREFYDLEGLWGDAESIEWGSSSEAS
jgi:ribosome-associated protein